MQIAFIGLWILGWVFFLKNRSHMPVAFVAYLGCSYYFYPGILGYCQVPLPKTYGLTTGGNTTPVELIDATYWVMYGCMIAVILAGLACLLLRPNIDSTSVKSRTSYLDSGLFLTALAWANFLGLALMLYFSGTDIFLKEKIDIMEQINNRGYVIWTTTSGMGFTLAYYAWNKKWILWFGCMLLMDLFIGFRFTTVFAGLAILCLTLERGKLTMKMIGGAALVFCFLLTFKNVNSIIKLQRWDLLHERVFSADFYLESLLSSEPMVTQAILNQALQDGARYEPVPLRYYLIQAVPFTRELLRADFNASRTFSGDALFPGLEYGVASNPWAELLVTYGVGGYLAFLFFFGTAIVMAQALYQRVPGGVWKVMIGINVALLFFYVHRNVLIYQYNMHRQYAYSFILVFTIYSVIAMVRHGAIWVRSVPANESKGKGTQGERRRTEP